ncbi:MAG TPA: hypothetical protein VFE52_03805 [Devosia sp.]|jgi:hypothetical protein|nr:hypothetical protein [Devosia sp.]
MLKRVVAAFVLSLALVVSAWAAELTPEQRTALETRIATFDQAMRDSDIAATMSVVPDKILQKIADTYGVTVEQMIEAAQEQMDQLLQGGTVTIESFGMDLDAARIEELADGTPYALIPTETVINLGAEMGKVRTRSETLGLLDEGQWYLLRTEDPQQAAILKEVYPGFADVEFAPATTEPVTP